jgi:8-oxo-dGTP pyrophosphatase MutT (NUDIX family)
VTAGAEIRAAGGVVWRAAGDATEVLLVHRPKYDDWTFPKGKQEPGESDKDTAVREVVEETGLRCRLGQELVESHYRDGHGRAKVVRYWEMTVKGGEFAPNAEVDEVRWLALGAAGDLLTYERDRPVLASFARLDRP